jgi:hypothetical protein
VLPYSSCIAQAIEEPKRNNSALAIHFFLAST